MVNRMYWRPFQKEGLSPQGGPLLSRVPFIIELVSFECGILSL